MAQETVTIKKTTLLLTISLVVVFAIGLLGGLAISGAFSNGSKTQTGGSGNSGLVKFDIPSFAPYRGSDSAKLYFVEFGDYQCPFCERFFTQTEQQILKD